MTKKYELVSSQNQLYYDIKALKDIPLHSVKAGDLGGRVEGEHNLSQEGDCWIEEGSMVRNQARVEGNALVCNNSIIVNNSCISGNVIVNDCRVSGSSNIKDNAVLTYCAVLGKSHVRGNARIQGICLLGDCDLYGDTVIIVPGHQRYSVTNIQGEITEKYFLTQGPALSSGRFSFGYRQRDGSVSVATGCFHGSLYEYLCAIEKTHRDNPEYLAQYRQFHQNFVEFFKA